MTFDEAIAAPGTKFQISGTEVKDGQRVLMVWRLDDNGAEQLAWRKVAETEHAAVVADLITRGLAVAETDFFCDFVWVTNADGIEVYDSECKVLHAAGDRATFADGRVVARADIACVFAFAEDDYIYRGVKALLRSGEELHLVTEASGSAMADPTYSRNELLWETGWTADIGRAIAKWAGAPFEYRV